MTVTSITVTIIAMNNLPKLLSKTKLLKGYRCQKNIYLTVHNPELEAPITPETQALFDQGNEVGVEARKQFPGGVLVDNVPWDFTGALSKTRQLLAAGTPIIYEAAFEYMGCYARADILVYSPDTKRFRIYEVKSTTKVKPEHLDDVGLQVWIMAKSGLPIEQINLLHLNTECRYPDLSNLFKQHDVTEEMRTRYLGVQPKIADLIKTLREPQIPDLDIGKHCIEPNACGFLDYCWKQKNIPAMSVFNLPKIRDRQWSLYQEGIVSLDDPRLSELEDVLQQRIIAAHRTGERYLNKAGIQEALKSWTYPFVFLDFETINPAIPCYDGCKPYQQVPFQFSVHRLDSPDATLTHEAFLHTELSDPRPALIPALLDACGTNGSIIAYYGQFEAARIQELADYSPEHAEALTALIERIQDPLPIIREHVYDPAFGGSFSLKRVAPALLGEAHSYEGMLVGNGNDAQRGYKRLINPALPPQEKQKLYQAMLDYCEKDTFVMVELVNWLSQQN